METNLSTTSVPRSRRHHLARVATVVALVLTALGTMGQPAHAADRSTFWAEYGASVTRGGIDWFNQSVNIDGTVYAASGSRRTYVWIYGNRYYYHGELERESAGDSEAEPFNVTIEVDVPGGAHTVVIGLQYWNGSRWLDADSDVCTRNGCTDQ